MVLTRRGEIVAAQHGRAGEGGRVSLINLDDPEFEYTFTDVRAYLTFFTLLCCDGLPYACTF